MGARGCLPSLNPSWSTCNNASCVNGVCERTSNGSVCRCNYGYSGTRLQIPYWKMNVSNLSMCRCKMRRRTGPVSAEPVQERRRLPANQATGTLSMFRRVYWSTMREYTTFLWTNAPRSFRHCRLPYERDSLSAWRELCLDFDDEPQHGSQCYLQ